MKRRYTKAAASVKVGSKTYKGLSVRQEGKFFVLTTRTGAIHVNSENGLVIEVTGMLQGSPVAIPVTPGAPSLVGGAVAFNAGRNRSLEGMMSLPGGFQHEA